MFTTGYLFSVIFNLDNQSLNLFNTRILLNLKYAGAKIYLAVSFPVIVVLPKKINIKQVSYIPRDHKSAPQSQLGEHFFPVIFTRL